MTISSEIRTAGPFTGDGVASAFPFSFKIFAATDVTVVQTDTNGIDTTLAYGTQFSVTMNADQNASPGGTITYKVASVITALPTGYKLNATSALSRLQPVALTNNGGFFPKVLNDAFDRAIILIQQLARSINGALRYPLSDGSALSGELPNAAARKGKYLGFSLADGSPTLFDSTITPEGSLSIGGSSNSVYGAGDDAVNIGGNNNTITGGALRATTIGGRLGTISTGEGNVIIGGSSSDITDSGDFSVIMGGFNNLISSTAAAAIGGSNIDVLAGSDNSVGIGGDNNTITAGATNCAIIGGSFGTISGSGNIGSVILGGTFNTISSAAYAVVSGQNAKGFFATSVTNASNDFSAVGDAQNERVVVMGSTSNNTPTEIRIGGTSGDRLVLPNDTAFMFDINIVARRTDADNECAAYQLIGCIDNNANTVALVGSVTKNVIAEDTVAWDVSATADNTNKSLAITVTGENAKTIRWVGSVNITRVTG